MAVVAVSTNVNATHAWLVYEINLKGHCVDCESTEWPARIHRHRYFSPKVPHYSPVADDDYVPLNWSVTI